jgi:hypothetical protein
MTIRESNSPGDSTKEPTAGKPRLTIRVAESRQLIGEGWYAPKFEATNSFEEPLIIRSVELKALGTTYPNKYPDPYPTSIRPRATQSLGAYFRLENDVKETFSKSAELLVYYEISGNKEVTRVPLIGR